MNRKRIADLILQVLQSVVPLRARQITSQIRLRPETEGVEVEDVNSVLYRELAGAVTQNGNFAWSIEQRHNHELLPLPIDASETPRAAYLRAIQRLRSGLPPQEKISELTIGNHRDVVHSVLDADERCNKWMAVVGDYGYGKSHSLTVFETEAREKGYATCHLSADSAASALNHPQRFLPILLRTLSFPGRRVFGYQDFLHEVLDDAESINLALDIVTGRLPESSVVRRDVVRDLISLKQGLGDRRDAAECLAHRRACAALLSGESLVARLADPSARNQAYQLLGTAQDLVVAFGARGLAVIIDEVESVYTKLPSRLSRYGAFRVLSAICLSNQLPRCCVAMAVTPDAWGQLKEIDISAAKCGCLESEPVAHWAKAIKDHSVPLLNCKPLAGAQKRELLERVAKLYAAAYPDLTWSGELSAAWQSFAAATSQAQVPVRISIRRAVDFLDLQRCRRP